MVQFATDKLGFRLEDISVYGWSIGGFTASWLGMNYKGLGAMILDATFDHVLPLAIPRMPAALEGVVRVAIHDNVNLAVADQGVNSADIFFVSDYGPETCPSYGWSF